MVFLPKRTSSNFVARKNALIPGKEVRVPNEYHVGTLVMKAVFRRLETLQYVSIFLQVPHFWITTIEMIWLRKTENREFVSFSSPKGCVVEKMWIAAEGVTSIFSFNIFKFPSG
jgi:hypothetical protein